MLSIFFFFSSRRRHTRFDCDWSSDVCSSDLGTIRDEEGTTVTGAGICANPPSTTEAPTCARSGAQGAYTIDVVAGTYKLDVTGPPGGKLIPQWGRGRLSSEEADIIDVRTTDVRDFDM